MALKITMAGEHAEIYIYDVIGESWFGGITAAAFARELRAVENAATIDVRINSAGGDVFDGITIHQLISALKGKVTIRVDGLAASIASMIAMASDKRIMNKHGFLMIHNPYTMAAGDAREMRKIADVLDAVREQLMAAYKDKTGIATDELSAMLDAETWINATTALEAGWITEISDAPAIAACANPLRPFVHAPAEIGAKPPQAKPPMRDRRAELSYLSRVLGV